MSIEPYVSDAVALLQKLIATPRISRDETAAADIMQQAMESYGYTPHRIGNNLWIESLATVPTVGEHVESTVGEQACPELSRRESTVGEHVEVAESMKDKSHSPITSSPLPVTSSPTIILNAHIDTVKPVSTWTRDPFTPTIEGDKLYGLGSNDCGGGLVSLLQVFRILSASPTAFPCDSVQGGSVQGGTFQGGTIQGGTFQGGTIQGGIASSAPTVPDGSAVGRSYNLIFLASCEEEVSGINGIRSVLPLEPFATLTASASATLTASASATLTASASAILPQATNTIYTPSPFLGGRAGVGGLGVGGFGGLVAIVGEPTGMQPAIAERGLMVIDGTAHGKSGHAARNEGINAIYEALDDLCFIRDYKFQKESPLLGPTKMQCTIVNSGTQHNVVPDECKFIIDVRTNEYYTNEEVFAFLQTKLKSELKARSFHLHSSSIPEDHPLIQRCKAMGMTPFGSPTLSDQALMRFPSFKLGPGQSSRSHSADEFICISEIRDAIEKYLVLLSNP